jgi:chemotaxis protein methyltransferase CheR
MESTETGALTLNPELSHKHFEKIAAILYNTSKITMQSGKEELVKSRLVKRMRALGLSGFDQYLQTVESDPAELYHMVDLLTTNKSSFFREDAHFSFMKARILPELKAGACACGARAALPAKSLTP